MDFGLSEDQRLWQASLSAVLQQVAPLERVRAFAAGTEPVARDVWSALAEAGAAGLLVPERHGGLGLGLLDAALTVEALGGQAAPAPALGVYLASLALASAGRESQQARWLGSLASGQALAGVGLSEAVLGGRDGAGVEVREGRLSGRALFVIDSAAADLLIIADREGGLHLVEADGQGVHASPLTTIDLTRRWGEIVLEGARAEPLGPSDGVALSRLRDAAWTLLAADMLGASQTLLDKAVAYAKERRQFGRVIGGFQAVKHMCAEMAAALEPCRALVWYAAYAFDALPDEASLAAAHAKAHLSEVSRFVARTATEVHGGIGITDLLGLHFWFKRVGVDRQVLGGPESVRDLAARLQGLDDQAA
jgi:alkylation response protein AidB-like acyl-CoA dehydrogenase